MLVVADVVSSTRLGGWNGFLNIHASPCDCTVTSLGRRDFGMLPKGMGCVILVGCSCFMRSVRVTTECVNKAVVE